jgi:HNH endonuclease
MTTKNGGPKKGFKQSKTHKSNIAKAQEGKKNSNYKHGKRLDYRKVAGAEKGDGSIVHHKNGDHTDNRKSNLQKLKGKEPGIKTSSQHEKMTKRSQGRPKGS